MTSITKDPRSLDEIEAQLDLDRAALVSSLTAMRAAVSGTAQTAQARLSSLKVPARASGGAKSIWTAIKANPIAVGMTVAGVAWLVQSCRANPECGRTQATTEIEAIGRWADDGGPVFESDPLIEEADQLRATALGLNAQDHKPLQNLRKSARHAMETAGSVAENARLRVEDAGKNTIGARPFLWAAGLAMAGATAALILPQAKREAQLVEGAKRQAQTAGRVIFNAQRSLLAEVAIVLAATSIKDLLLTPRAAEATSGKDDQAKTA